MWQQKSFEDEQIKGILYLVPTPIGNLEDMSYRAIRILKEADYIAAEDTRNSKKLCHYFEIETPLMSYHEHNKETSGKKIVNLLKEGAKIALISDAGLPTISDPGYEVVVSATGRTVNRCSSSRGKCSTYCINCIGYFNTAFLFLWFSR